MVLIGTFSSFSVRGLRYVTFLVIASIVAMFMCVKYLQLRSELTQRSKHITAMQRELVEMKEANNIAITIPIVSYQSKFLNKNIITLKTDLGLINPNYIDNLEIKENSALIFTSFAGYTAEQDTKSISKYCKDNNITTIEDASAGIGDKKHVLGNGKYSDIIIASTGSPKIINVGSGGFIATSNPDIFTETTIPQKLSKTNEIICSGIDSEIDNVGEKLEVTRQTISKWELNETTPDIKQAQEFSKIFKIE